MRKRNLEIAEISTHRSAKPLQGSLQRVYVGLLFFVGTLLVAITGYMAAGWSLLDSLYMVVITIFGVGYGEVRPITEPGLRVFTILVIIAGTSASVYTIGGFVQMITEGEIHQALGARRMSRGIETLNQHVIICGFGRIGQILARELTGAKQPFVVIDNKQEKVDQAIALGYWTKLGDATQEEVLQSVGIDRAQVLATVLRNDAANVFITLTGRSLNPNLMIVARGEFPSTEKKLLQAGADHVVLPTAIGGLRIAHLITHPAAVEFLNQQVSRSLLNEQLTQIGIQLVNIDIPEGSPLVGQTLGYLEVRGKSTFLIVALRRADGSAISDPGHELLLQGGDSVIVIGRKDDIPQFVQRYQTKKEIKFRGAQA
ncbi:MAG: NAD-binding protein [Cyanobacteriota bacterium]|nr:NAD-binding protein [Cyanobacteriota bacterium]